MNYTSKSEGTPMAMYWWCQMIVPLLIYATINMVSKRLKSNKPWKDIFHEDTPITHWVLSKCMRNTCGQLWLNTCDRMEIGMNRSSQSSHRARLLIVHQQPIATINVNSKIIALAINVLAMYQHMCVFIECNLHIYLFNAIETRQYFWRKCSVSFILYKLMCR